MTLVIKNKITSDSIGFYIDFSNRRCFAPNLLNYSTWTPGSGSIIPDSTKYGTTNFSVVSSVNNENIRVYDTNPFGYDTSVVWKGFSLDSTTVSGGNDGGFICGFNDVDSSKMYRYTLWTKRDNMTPGLATQSGQFYMGVYSFDESMSGEQVLNIRNNSSSESNMYFHTTPNSFTSNYSDIQPPYLGGLNVWTLVVGHVWPYGSESGVVTPGSSIGSLGVNYAHPDSGIWTINNGKVGNLRNSSSSGASNYSDWVWNLNSSYSRHRAYHYYSGDSTATQSFIYPRVDIVDGLEPSISELLSGTEPVRDLSPKLNTLYPFSTTNFDKEGKGLVFSGIEQEIIGGPLQATFSVNSMSIWFQPSTTIDSSTSGQTLVQFGSAIPDPFVIFLGSHTTSLTGEVISIWNETNYHTGVTSITLSAGVWYNLVINWAGTNPVFLSNNYKIYLNGVLQSSVSGGSGHATFKSSVDYVAIGGRKYSTTTGRYFDGKIGSIVTYERTLSAVEILENYKSMKKKYGL
jgi:hypothetical protein